MTTTTISKKKTRRPRRILFILLPILLILVLGFSILFFLSHQNLIFQFRNNLAATLDTHIKRLRSSLEEYRSCIVTLRGVGYRFDDHI